MPNIYSDMSFQFDEVILEFVKNSFNAFNNSKPKRDWHPTVCEIEIELNLREGYFSITDNGPGFLKSDLESLLGRFSSSTFREKKGVKFEIGTYGLGVVAASSWLGDKWEISTKRDAENYIEKLTVDASKFFEESPASQMSKTKIPWGDANTQFSSIKIQLNDFIKIPSRMITKTKHRIAKLLTCLNYYDSIEIVIQFNGKRLELTRPKFSFSESFVLNVKGFEIGGEVGVLSINERRSNLIWPGIYTYWKGNFIDTGSLSDILPKSPVATRRRIYCLLNLDMLEPTRWKNGFLWNKISRDELKKALLSDSVVKAALHYSKRNDDFPGTIYD